jgi:diaminopimelate decarboxylase
MKAMGPIPAAFTSGDSGGLLIGERTAEELVGQAGGTPLFVYDKALIGQQIARFRMAMPDQVALHYAVKANPYSPLLRFLASYVDGFDVASAGELDRLDQANADMLPISFAGPGKRDAELERAIEAGVTINLESEHEADRAHAIAQRLGKQPKLAVRVNPPFALKGAGMKMGGLASPFGLDSERVPALIRQLIDAGADWRGLHVFAGSQSLNADAIADAQRRTIALVADICENARQAPPEINLGGGFGIPYFAGDQPLDIDRIGTELAEALRAAPDLLADTRLAVELGRWLVGEAGVYLTRIVDRKQSGGRTFLITDGGLHHMLAASGNFGQLLRRNYPAAIADRFNAPPEEEVTITGCLCTPLDLLADEVMLPRADAGDLVAIFCAGAYGMTASPRDFLSQPNAREMMA